MVERRGKGLTSNTVTSNEQTRHPKLGFTQQIFVQRFSFARIYGPENISIGNNVRIDDFAILSAKNGSISIGNYVFIARNSHLSGFFGIEIHDFSSMAANTVIYSASDDYSGDYLTAQAIPQKYTTYIGGAVVIGKHVIIGSACSIFGPSIIGEGYSLGAMTLVTRDLKP